MKKVTLLITLFCAILGIASAQNSYWVFFTDKQSTTFDPYQYFDAKAIERYAQNGADLYDITNYPVNSSYAAQVEAACEELVGTSRWLNAAGVMATDDQITVIRQFPFVAGIQLIAGDMEVASAVAGEPQEQLSYYNGNQILIHKGEMFKQHSITGKGVRIAVLDGGFTGADTHPAFQHLRDNNQILKTWNFVKKKENVYEGHYHGRMVLSCIAGVKNDTSLLGMAPDAQFLLARTEVNTEPKKEEVWWVQALEWADQNGADIVNSSLGYGKQRYSVKQMDGKTSMVAKAANTAARKGMLVCNSMGNEGDDKEWKMLITPADADSILSVGAVYSINTLADFSSFGPTADGRMKPNVVAMGRCMVAGDKGNFSYSYGTSFSSPMVTGFAACVKQLHPEYTAWQLKTEIEKSGNHYPYFDYAFGYGVPQADFFFEEEKEPVKKVFTLKEDETSIYVEPEDEKELTIFYKITNGDKSIAFYNKTTMEKNYKTGAITPYYFNKNLFDEGQQLEIWSEGQYASYKFGGDKVTEADSLLIEAAEFITCNGEIDVPDNDIFTRRFPKTYKFSTVLNASFIIPAMWGGHQDAPRMSRTLTFAFDNSWRLARCYAIGFRIGFGSSWYAVPDNVTGIINPEMNKPYEVGEYFFNDEDAIFKKNVKVTKFDLEFVNRFILGSAGQEWWYIDAGIFGEWNTGSRFKLVLKEDDQRFVYDKAHFLKGQMNPVDYGVRVRAGITRRFAVFGQYRISRIIKKDSFFQKDLPQWEVGVQFF